MKINVEAIEKITPPAEPYVYINYDFGMEDLEDL
jgi:hypothetical protein